MTEDEREQAYTEGSNAAWREMLATAIRGLGGEGDAERWRVERADLVAALRRICADYGDNYWPDNLHLGDVIEKHLARYLDSVGT